MLCAVPYRKGVLELGCGRCRPCRINRSRQWVGRMLLESCEHPYSAFVTLTYKDMVGPLWLDKRHLQLFLKRLRSVVFPRMLRYYAVGEYGDQSWRPHYHLVVFGLSPTEEELVRASWPFGFVVVGTAEARSMSYVAQYVTKKMTSPKDRRLLGRPPEFSMMSLKPGLGSGVIARIKKAVSEHPSTDKFLFDKFRVSGYKYPLGRYIRDGIDEAIGVLPEQRRARLRVIVEELFATKISKDTETYETERGAKVLAALGRSIRKDKVL